MRFYDEHAAQQQELRGDLRAHWSKLEACAARLALVIHTVRQVSGDEALAYEHTIDETSIAAAVRLVRWFGAEACRVYALLEDRQGIGRRNTRV